MLPIHKKNVDPLCDFKRIPDVTFSDNRLPKKELKQSLLDEQGHLCAYCMSRITNDNMSVEHWKPQHPKPISGELTKEQKEQNRLLSLNYANMLAVCDGNEGESKNKQHCDTRKGNMSLKYNPSQKEHHPLLKIRYVRSSGKIESEDSIFCAELGDMEKGTEGILNLNCEKLCNNRKEVIRIVQNELSQLSPNAVKAKVYALLEKWNTPSSDSKLREYAGVAVYFLEKRMKFARN